MQGRLPGKLGSKGTTCLPRCASPGPGTARNRRVDRDGQEWACWGKEELPLKPFCVTRNERRHNLWTRCESAHVRTRIAFGYCFGTGAPAAASSAAVGGSARGHPAPHRWPRGGTRVLPAAPASTQSPCPAPA
eukprot:scaffold2854_cov116-Isochrysis_galbana.AAC.7